jgi:hypothetical protein
VIQIEAQSRRQRDSARRLEHHVRAQARDHIVSRVHEISGLLGVVRVAFEQYLVVVERCVGAGS